MVTQQDVIKKFMKSLDTTTKTGVKALDAAIKAGSNSAFSSFNELKQAMINDCKNAKNADYFLKTYCGINLDNSDTGAITGLDAGGSKAKTASSIIPESGSLNEFTSGSWFNNIKGQDGLIVQLAKTTGSIEYADNIAIKYFNKSSDLSKQETYLWRSTYTWWIRNGLDLIAESYGDNFSFDKNKSSATNKDRTIYIIFEDFGEGDLASTWGGPANSQKSTNKLRIQVNLNYYKNATGKNGEVKNEQHLDRTFAHELTHAVMRSNIDYYDYLPAIIKEGVAELTHGIDDVRTNGIKKLAGNSSLLSQALSLKTNADDVKVEGVKSPAYSGGYMLMRYFAKQSSDFNIKNTNDKSVLTFRGNDSITNFVSNAKITTGAGKDTVHVGSAAKKVTIDSGLGNDFVNNWGASARITTGSGNDTVHNSSVSSSVYIDTGSGNDSIENHASKVTIFAYSGNDTIESWGNYGKIFGGAGNDSIVNGSSSNTIANNVTIDGGSGDDKISNWGLNASIQGGDGSDTIWSGDGKDTVYGGADNDIIYGEAGNDKLFGGAGNDKLYGGANNDSLWGGAGNDSLWGGSGNDVFIYTVNEGTDKIFDYEKGDMLKILKADGSNGSFKSSKYSGGDLTLTINGGGKIIFDDVSSSMNFNINGTTYKISSSKLVKK